MKFIDTSDANAMLAEYAAGIGSGPVIVTSEGRPVAALVPIENTDFETASLGTNQEFLELIARSRSSLQTEGGVSSDEMRRRFE
jgi:prevent-host-death family protein